MRGAYRRFPDTYASRWAAANTSSTLEKCRSRHNLPLRAVMICLSPFVPHSLRDRLLAYRVPAGRGRSLAEYLAAWAVGCMTRADAEEAERYHLAQAVSDGDVELADPQLFRLMYRLLAEAVHRDIGRRGEMSMLDAADLLRVAAAMERDARGVLPTPADAQVTAQLRSRDALAGQLELLIDDVPPTS